MSKSVRGHTFFKSIIDVKVPKQRKGRSIEFITKRNNCLIDRYLFYALATKDRYEAITMRLSEFFFLSQYTLAEIITDHSEQVIKLKKQYSVLPIAKLQKEMQIKWPDYNWKV
jgi:hypothetical protein